MLFRNSFIELYIIYIYIIIIIANPLGDEGVRSLVNLFPNLPYLSKLSLNKCNITDIGVKLLLNYSSEKLKVLEIGCIYINIFIYIYR